MSSFLIELKAKTGLIFMYKPLSLQRFSETDVVKPLIYIARLFYCHIVVSKFRIAKNNKRKQQ